MEIRKFNQLVAIPDGVLQQQADLAAIMAQCPVITPAERAEREAVRRKAADDRRHLRETTPPVTELADILQGVSDRMGWSMELLNHLAQPYCECELEQYEGCLNFCDHARDLGLTF